MVMKIHNPRYNKRGLNIGIHVWRKFRIGESDICPCDTEPMTVEHILGRCPRLATVRMEIWPEGTCLLDQLCGDKQQL
jgi:hypothetical protein